MLIFKKMTVVSLFLLAVIFLYPKMALAQDAFTSGNLENLSVYTTRSIFDMIVGIVNVALGFLGAITVLLFLYAGYLWLTSRGAADRIDQAKKIMINATIGLGIIFVSYALVNFIFRSAYEGIFGGGPGGNNNYNPSYSGGVLGGVLESHYPAWSATNIPRNTNIIVTFREAIDLEQILLNDSCDPVSTDCAVDRNNIMVFVAGNEDSNLANNDLLFRTDAAHKNFVFNPVPLLGDSNEPVDYRVQLNNLRTENGSPVFSGSNYYYWIFSVGTWVDEVPPYVVSVVPIASTVARNTIVQINFSESVNPLYIPAVSDAAANIRLSDPNLIDGVFQLSNQYRTVEFLTNSQCGQNSCGFNIFCLPASATIDGIIIDEVRDMVGNQLDGNHDGDHDVNDNFDNWQFNTNNDIDTTGPIMTYRDRSDDWNIYAPIRISFDSSLSAASVNYDNVKLDWNINYWLGLASYEPTYNNSIMIYHNPMAANTDYSISCLSGIRDLQQNCYQPCNCPLGSPGCGANPPMGTPCPPGTCSWN